MLGIRVQSWPPFGTAEFPLTIGTTAIVGVNGVGKTRMLDAIRLALSGDSDIAAEVLVRLIDEGEDDEITQAILEDWKATDLKSLLTAVELELLDVFAAVPFNPRAQLIGAIVEQKLFALRYETDDGFRSAIGVNWASEDPAIRAWNEFAVEGLDSALSQWDEDPELFWPTLVEADGFPPGLYRYELGWNLHASTALPVAVAFSPRTQEDSNARSRFPFNWKTSRHTSRGTPPGWPIPAPINVDDTARIDRLTREVVMFTLDGDDLLFLAALEEGDDSPDGSLLIEASDESPIGDAAAKSFLARTLRELVREATHVLNVLMPGTGQFALRLEPPYSWLNSGSPVRWSLEKPDGTSATLESLGAAHRRWANFAIAAALHAYHGEANGWLVIDEPEHALHRAAEPVLAAGITALSSQYGFNVLTTTHSPAFFGSADAAVVIYRGERRAEVRPVPTKLRELAEVAGVSGLDLMGGWLRSFVLVEGQHDVAVIDTLLGDVIAANRSTLLPLGGVRGTAATVDASLLAENTEAQLIVVIDGLGPKTAEIWERAKARARDGDGSAATSILRELERIPGYESTFVRAAGERLIETEQFDRLTLVPLSVPDILDLLPVGDFVAGAKSWGDLRTECGRRSGSDFKQWLRSVKRARINTRSIRSSASKLDVIPSDLLALQKALEKASDRAT